MTRSLRRAHRRLVCALALLLPILILFALAGREEPPIQQDWPFKQR